MCNSALLAVERFADERIAAGEPIATVVERLLADCHNLAMPGLVIGLLKRHIANVSDELDLWIARPEIWELKVSRATYEGVLHVQDPTRPTRWAASFASSTSATPRRSS